MASGSSGRASHSGSKAFDFGSDDILCSYEDYGNPDGTNGIHTDTSGIPNSTKEFNKSRVARSSAFTAANYSTPEESSFNEGVIFTVENTMKKYTDNLMRFLEGISSRMSQLELYCYNLDKSIGEMRSDLSRGQRESESKLKSLEKHLQEVHRSVQILRDKQELADTQKELAKLQLAHKESSLSGGGTGSSTQQQAEEASEAKKGNENPSSDGNNEQQLALALPPHQVAPPPPHHQPPSVPHQQPSMAPLPQSSSMPLQTMSYYLPPPPASQMTAANTANNNNITAPSQQYPPQNPPPQPNQQNPQVVLQPLTPYQQQWAPSLKSQMGVYSPYVTPTHQPSQSPIENSSLPMQRPASAYIGPPPQDYGYVSASVSRPASPMPQHLKTTGASAYGQQSGDAYFPGGPRPTLPPGNSNTYVVFDGEGGRAHHHLPHMQQQTIGYPPNSGVPLQRMPPSGGISSSNNMNMDIPQPPPRGHPYNELIDKLVGMGYRGDHVVAIIQRMDETGQPIDFNSVLDMLNGGHPHSMPGGGASQRGWRP